MGHYKSNVRDLEFNLFEVLDLEKALATGAFGDLDGDSVHQMLAEASRQAEGPLAESFADADRNPPTFDPDTHAVSLPESLKKSVRAWQRGEWFRIGLDEHVGGVVAPSIVAWASRTTADSRHPPLTEPAIRPSRLTSSRAPIGRGVEPEVPTTVAIAISGSLSLHSLMVGSRSRMSPVSPDSAGRHKPRGVRSVHNAACANREFLSRQGSARPGV